MGFEPKVHEQMLASAIFGIARQCHTNQQNPRFCRCAQKTFRDSAANPIPCTN